MGQSQGPKIVNGVILPPLLDLHTSTDREVTLLAVRLEAL